MGAYYQSLFDSAKAAGASDVQAACDVANAFLDGKPASLVTGSQKQQAFWSCAFISVLPPEAWRQQPLQLALVRYLGQDGFACHYIVAHLADTAPDALQWAARHSGLVSRQASPRFREIEALATSHPHEFAEFVWMFHIFRRAREERVAEVERFRAQLAGLRPLELLAYASLYAFQHIVPVQLEEPAIDVERDASQQVRWDAIDQILAWKLATCEAVAFKLDDAVIGRALRTHLMPFLLPSPHEPPRSDLYAMFSALMEAQVELQEFDARSAEAFSFDDSIRFARRGDGLDIEEIDPEARMRWRRMEQKSLRLHGYWLRRGLQALSESAELQARIHPANFDIHAMATAKALAAWLCLQEVYGVEARVDTGSGAQVDMFNALMSIELMTAFYNTDFLQPFRDAMERCGQPWQALGMLAMSGCAQGENRLPLTWSERAVKIARITPWTASRDRPQGHPRAAEAILDFWTSDWDALAQKLRAGEAGLSPRLQELPILKMGRHLVQLPWMQATQNNRVAAINNLRRLGQRREQVRGETGRIEQRLGEVFAGHGFNVLVAHALPVSPDVGAQIEEIDLLCARDGYLLVLEVKSTYVRRSMKDAWLHRTTTLRKAGRQLQRKVAAVHQRLSSDAELNRALGLPGDAQPLVIGWIVDTSIECDRESFDGFLKLPLEEILVALRDDRHLLHGLSGLLQGEEPRPPDSLYPAGFNAARFIDAVESGAVWNEVI